MVKKEDLNASTRSEDVLSPDSFRGAGSRYFPGHLSGLKTGILLHEVAKLRRDLFQQMVRPLGISQHRWWVLAYLMHKNGVAQTEIAEYLGLGRPSTGELIDRLEQDGWVVRRGDIADRRTKCIYLTENTKQLFKKAWAAEREFGDKLFAGIEVEDRDQFLRTLSRMKNNLLLELT